MLGEPSDKSETAVARVLDRLDRVTKRPKGWSARCPAHEDDNPSLSVGIADGGGVLVYCFAGCPRERIVAALGLQERDLWPLSPAIGREAARPISNSAGAADPVDAATPDKLSVANLAAAKQLPIDFLWGLGVANGGSGVRIPYHDADGTVVRVRSRLAMTGDRFRWRRGDRPLPYGLWRLEDARAAGWIVLVEGESDCWTLWHWGVAALGIPGKTTWRAEWAAYVEGLVVYLWQEPDAEDLVERVASDLANLRVMIAPSGTKDVSDAHVRGDDVAALVDRARAASTPAREVLERRAREASLAAHEVAKPILEHPDPIELVEAEIRAQRYGGDLRAPMLAYLAMTTRLLAPRRGGMLAHVIFIGPSSGGKNAALQAALRLLPDEAVHVIDAGSPRVLIYDAAPLAHRVVVFSEADSLPAGEDNPAASAIRNLLQDGRLHYQVTVPDPTTGAYTVHKVDKPGPTVLMTTSTRRLGHQLMTRLFTVEIPDEPGHVRAALAAQAALELDDPPLLNEALVAFQRYLGSLAPIDVVVPFTRSLETYLGGQPGGPRVLRDFPRLLSLIKAATVLRLAHRNSNMRGRLEAEVDDYRVVHNLLAESYEASAGASTRIRDAVTAVAELATAMGAGATVSVSDVAAWLGVSESSAWRRVQDALAGKWLVNDEHRRSQTAKLRLGEPLPARAGLPTPEVVLELHGQDASQGAAGVFTFAPYPAVSRPTTDRHRVGNGPISSVIGENAQTIDVDPQLSPPPVPLNFGIFVEDDEEWSMGLA